MEDAAQESLQQQQQQQHSPQVGPVRHKIQQHLGLRSRSRSCTGRRSCPARSGRAGRRSPGLDESDANAWSGMNARSRSLRGDHSHIDCWSCGGGGESGSGSWPSLPDPAVGCTDSSPE